MRSLVRDRVRRKNDGIGEVDSLVSRNTIEWERSRELEVSSMISKGRKR
jgi:hypothetical protein